MQRSHTVEQLQHLFFIPAVEGEIFNESVVPAVSVNYKAYRSLYIKAVKVINRYDGIPLCQDSCHL